MQIEDIDQLLQGSGFTARGGFHSTSADDVPVQGQTVVLVGNIGPEMWARFQASPDATPATDDPLDRWTKSTLTGLAGKCGATPLFPFDGPPHLPFQRWAQKADDVYPSPIGPLIHPTYGLWHAYRGAFIFEEILDLPQRNTALPSPCDDCVDRPCLSACPVGALSDGALDTDTCTGYMSTGNDDLCFTGTCQARSACPIGRDYAYHPDQGRFHMSAYLRACRP